MKNYFKLGIWAAIAIAGNSYATPTTADIMAASNSIKSAIHQLTYALDSAAKATDESSHTGKHAEADRLRVMQAVANAINGAASSLANDLATIVSDAGSHPNISNSTNFAKEAIKSINTAQQSLSK